MDGISSRAAKQDYPLTQTIPSSIDSVNIQHLVSGQGQSDTTAPVIGVFPDKQLGMGFQAIYQGLVYFNSSILYVKISYRVLIRPQTKTGQVFRRNVPAKIRRRKWTRI